MVLKPATPGFITTLVATALLAVVSFSVPWFKSVYFLRASLASSGVSGSITFGVLGFCTDIGGNVTCSKPSVGYELDINALVGDKLPIQIPQVIVKWLTYALVLHIVALVLAAISSVFGLLAHVREMSMTCFSSCISGLGASVALLAFIFDLALFFIARARINKVQGGSATIGNGIWLTLVAWILLFISGCMFGIGRCCLGKRPRAPRGGGGNTGFGGFGGMMGRTSKDQHHETMRLDAVKAEADRKARQQAGVHEIGLPSFTQLEHTPLNRHGPQYLEDEDDQRPYSDHNKPAPIGGVVASNVAPQPRRQGSDNTASRRQPTFQEPQYTGGYAQGAPGSRAVDAYGHPQPPLPVATPAPSTVLSAYSSPPEHPSPVGSPYRPNQNTAYGGGAQYLDPYGGGGAQHLDPYAAGVGTHHMQGSSYHSAYSHQQDPSYYNPQAGAYGAPPELPRLAQQQQQLLVQPQYGAGHNQSDNGAYSTPSVLSPVVQHAASPRQAYASPWENPYANQGQQQQQHAQPQAQYAPQPAPINTNVGGAYVSSQPSQRQSAVGGPRGPRSPPMSPTRTGWDQRQSPDSLSEAPPNYSLEGASSNTPYYSPHPQARR